VDDNMQHTGRRRIRYTRLIAIVAGALVLLGGSALAVKNYLGNLGSVLPSKPIAPVTTPYQFTHRVTVLLMGSSLQTSASNHVITAKNARNRTDTMILVSIDPATHQVGVLSIPRDTRVYVPGVGMTKIAEASYEGGLPEAVKVVEATFHVPVDYYAYLSMFQFPKLINDMGGLTVDVPRNEVYDASNGKLGIDLKAGVQKLNGWQVLAFARFRQTSQGDISRIQQQQQVLKDIAHQLLQPKYIPEIPTLVNDFSSIVTTNMSTTQMLALALFMRNVNMSTVRYGTVPGEAITAYDPLVKANVDDWAYNQHLTSVVIQNVLIGDPLTASQKKSIKIYVASGTSTLAPAQALATELTNAGYTVTGVGWANNHNHIQTTILNDTGDKALSKTMQQLVGSSTVQFTAYHTTPWDIKITVGSDFKAPSSSSGSSG
jgi:LCP family protein required for cell wall assembly